MDALTSALFDNLLVNTESVETDTGPGEDGDTDRRASYKNTARLGASQEARRRELLSRQKRERDSRLSRLRALTADDGDPGQQEGEEAMDTAALPGAFSYSRKAYYKSQYSNQLMFSEWMEETPTDLETDWLLKMCPAGKRCLVVAKKRSTRSYSAAGALLRSFPSRLPAGWRGPLGQRPTVLDCIWEQAADTFHVLDLLCWNGHQVFDCEAEFRFSWLQSKLSESPELGVASRSNPYRFVAIPQQACSPAGLAASAAAAAEGGADGALFFHRGGHYRPGATPLALWLKPFMLPEAVGVPQTAAELGAPADYPGRAQFVREWEQARERRRSQRKPDSRMEP